MMKVLILSNGELVEKEIENTLENLQQIVGGYIEMPMICKEFMQNEIDIIINEEGKYIDGLSPEIAIASRKAGTVVDVIMGNCIFASHDAEGNTIGLNDNQIEIVKETLKTEAVLNGVKDNKSFLAKILFV